MTDDDVEKLVTDNMKLAHFFADRNAERLGYDVALSAAMAGLWKAAQEYDGRVPFGSFASLHCKWATGRAWSITRQVKRGGNYHHCSIDEEIYEGKTIGDTIAAPETSSTEAIETKSSVMLASLVRGLDTRQKMIIVMRFGLNGSQPKTLAEVAVTLGLTRERVRQIEEKAINKLKRGATRT